MLKSKTTFGSVVEVEVYLTMVSKLWKMTIYDWLILQLNDFGKQIDLKLNESETKPKMTFIYLHILAFIFVSLFAF